VPPLDSIARRVPLAISAFVVGVTITALLYGAAVTGFFIFDDFVWLECAKQSHSELAHLFNLHISGFWRPLAHLVFAGLYALFGLAPAGYHLAAWLFHALCAALLAQATLRLTGDRRLGLLAAVLFVLNPIYQETTLWIAALNEPVSAAVGLAALLGWHRFLTRDGGAAWRGYALGVAGVALALAAKESTVTVLPALALLHLGLHLLRRAEVRRRSLLCYLLPAAVLGAYLVAQALVQRENGLVTRGEYEVGLHAALRLWRNLWELGRHTWPLFAAAALGALAGRRWRRRDLLVALYLVGVVATLMLPYLMFRWKVMASRYFYTSAMVVAVLGALALRHLITSRGPLPKILALLALAGVTWHAAAFSGLRTRQYVATAGRIERFVRAMRAVPAPRPETLLVDSPLAGQHLEAAMRLFHPSHEGRFRHLTDRELAAHRGAEQIWRWHPRQQLLTRVR
jgi:hypothetical protein